MYVSSLGSEFISLIFSFVEQNIYLDQNWTLSAFNQSRYNKALAVKPSTGIYFSPALSGKLIKKIKGYF